MKAPYEINQTWRMKGYDWEKRKAKFYPVVFARKTIFDRSIPIKREVWIDWIRKGWLSTSDQMREWLDSNGYADVQSKTNH